jgi:hypothetical protein
VADAKARAPPVSFRAVKPTRQVKNRGALSARFTKASRALAGVQATAPRAEWPEAMKRELMTCKTSQDQHAWTQRWALYLGGQVLSTTPRAPERSTGIARHVGRQPL